MVTICVDAMGGDSGTDVVLEGIAQALEADEQLQVLVAGDADVISAFCEEHERALPLVTTEVIGMGEHPSTAVHAKKDSSIVHGRHPGGGYHERRPSAGHQAPGAGHGHSRRLGTPNRDDRHGRQRRHP